MSNKMICEETKTGQVHCILPEEHQGTYFKVEKFADNEDVLDEYYAKLFAETCTVQFYEFYDQSTADICKSSLEQAIQDYDKYNFACQKMFIGGKEIRQKV